MYTDNGTEYEFCTIQKCGMYTDNGTEYEFCTIQKCGMYTDNGTEYEFCTIQKCGMYTDNGTEYEFCTIQKCGMYTDNGTEYEFCTIQKCGMYTDNGTEYEFCTIQKCGMYTDNGTEYETCTIRKCGMYTDYRIEYNFYGVFISQLIRYARAWSSYECVIPSATWLWYKFLGKGYIRERSKFYCRCGDLTKHSEVSLSKIFCEMTILYSDVLKWSFIAQNRDLVTELALIPTLNLLPNSGMFLYNIFNGCG